ncbi:hypothetical protein DPEC_G00162840 [Dallia pectoralis]|uniref:Uncharacterized protein n=1 Tax=Dallia pectoralis TaxID=75939 RepID=A0ACC2GGK1_DALPE|nr:hypothetical protein DPEC_G00162840 [Dallia pectoralis]
MGDKSRLVAVTTLLLPDRHGCFKSLKVSDRDSLDSLMDKPKLPENGGVLSSWHKLSFEGSPEAVMDYSLVPAALSPEPRTLRCDPPSLSLIHGSFHLTGAPQKG